MAGEVVVVNVATTRDPRQVVHDRIDRYDAATGTLLSSVELSEQIASVSGDAAAGHGYVWATQPTPDDRMARIDPATGEVVRLDARSQGRVLIGNEDVWVVSNESIDRIDTATLSASVLPAPWEGTTLALAGRFAGPPPAALAGDHLLVGVVVRTEEEVPRADRPVQALVRVDLRTGLLDAQIELGDAAPKRSDTASPSLNEIVVGGDTLWFGGTYGLASVPLNAVLGPAS